MIIPTAYDGRTVSSVLKDCFGVSETYLRRLKNRPGSVCLNGEPVYVVARVKPGDALSFDPSDGERFPIRPIPFPLEYAYEDEWLAVLNKPKNLSVHPARDPDEPTVENALAAHFTGFENPHPVSRLDKGTTGLMLVAKSGYVHALLKAQQTDGRFEKQYLAITVGVPKPPHLVIEAPIGAKAGSTYQREVRADGAPAKSECTVLASHDGLALCALIPHTGRTHQLRVHMAHAGYPLLGDWLYGQRSQQADRPMLHAASLWFVHPVTNEPVALSCPPPEDFRIYFPCVQ